MHEPPVQPDCCACSGNYHLESNPDRHDKTPLAAAIGNWISRAEIQASLTRVLEVAALLRLHWKDSFGYLRSAEASYLGSETCRFTEPSKSHLAGWFFRLLGRRLRPDKKDLKKINSLSRRRRLLPNPKKASNRNTRRDDTHYRICVFDILPEHVYLSSVPSFRPLWPPDIFQLKRPPLS